MEKTENIYGIIGFIIAIMGLILWLMIFIARPAPIYWLFLFIAVWCGVFSIILSIQQNKIKNTGLSTAGLIIGIIVLALVFMAVGIISTDLGWWKF